MERSVGVRPPGMASRPVGVWGGKMSRRVIWIGGRDWAAEFEGVAREGDGADSLGCVAVGGVFLGGVVESAAGVGGGGGGAEFGFGGGGSC